MLIRVVEVRFPAGFPLPPWRPLPALTVRSIALSPRSVGLPVLLFVAALVAGLRVPVALSAQVAPSRAEPAGKRSGEMTLAPGRTAFLASPLGMLQSELDGILRGSAGQRASVGADVVSLTRGDTLYSLNAERLLEPASNMKLFTAAAALHYLGPSFTFRTTLYGTGPVDAAGVLQGDLVLEGRGDPNLSGRFYGDSVPYVFDELIGTLRTQGVTRVAGDLVGDDTYFDGPALGEGWSWDTQQWWYSAEAAALSFNDNTITLFAEPGAAAGDPAVVRKVPETDYVTVQNEVETVRGRGGGSVSMEREPAGNRVTLSGRVPLRGGGASIIVSVHQPASFALAVFRDRLARAGVAVDGRMRLVEPGYDLEQKARRTALATHLSPPLSETVKVVNKRSQNFYAEQLLRTIGAEVRGRGTAEAGIAVIDEFLHRQVGAEPGSIYMVDGSGLSRLNLVTPRTIVQLLTYMSRHPYAREFYESLLVPGEDAHSYRLDEPLTRANVHAKTGTVRYVSAYSGYVTAADGERLVFSILLNNRPDGKASSVLLENAVVRALARFDR